MASSQVVYATYPLKLPAPCGSSHLLQTLLAHVTQKVEKRFVFLRGKKGIPPKKTGSSFLGKAALVLDIGCVGLIHLFCLPWCLAKFEALRG